MIILNYHKIDEVSISNGIGIRTVLWVSGCSHNCYNCQNPQTHDRMNGRPFDDEAMDKLFACLSKPYVDGITFSGGDPLYIWNFDTIRELSRTIKRYLPGTTQWLYTGYTWEEIINQKHLLEAISCIDVIVDGKYMDSLRDTTLPFRGSSNQRIIDVQKSIANNKVILWGDDNE